MNIKSSNFVIEDTTYYNHFTQPQNSSARASHNSRFWNLADRSKYALCPRGAGSSSIRIFEMMEAGIAPVIISDEWLPPKGPAWDDFALFMPESDICSIYEFIKQHEDEYLERGRQARLAWEKHFSPEHYWVSVIESIQEIKLHQKHPEWIYAKCLPFILSYEWIRQQVKLLTLKSESAKNKPVR